MWFRCIVMDVLEHPQQGETKFFLTTYMRIDKLYFVDVPKSLDSCPDAAGVDEIRDDARKIGVNLVGVCLFNTVDQYFAINPEDIPLVSKRTGYVVVERGSTLCRILGLPALLLHIGSRQNWCTAFNSYQGKGL